MSLSRYLDPYPVLFHGTVCLCLTHSLTHSLKSLRPQYLCLDGCGGAGRRAVGGVSAGRDREITDCD